jgi:putative hemolysin
MRIFSFLTVFLSVTLPVPPALAHDSIKLDCGVQRKFEIEGVPSKFCADRLHEAWITQACSRRKKNPCAAMKLLRDAGAKVVELKSSELSGGRTPGAVLCGKLGGVVRMARYSGGNQQSFCQGGDGSSISCNALANQYFSNK